jgi:hypothetical protein
LTAVRHVDQSERSLFVESVCGPRHFTKSDAPLLASYVQATLLSRAAVKKAASDPAMLALWEKSTRMQSTLATRLRLSPASRADPKTVARERPSLYRKPWEDREPWENHDDVIKRGGSQ